MITAKSSLDTNGQVVVNDHYPSKHFFQKGLNDNSFDMIFPRYSKPQKVFGYKR
jgi:hypothetical protein